MSRLRARLTFRRAISLLAALVASSAFSSLAWAEILCAETDAAEAARRVQGRYDGIEDFAADFVQQSWAASFAGNPLIGETTKRGTVVLAKPGRMRWTYTEPEPSVVVSDGRILWIHDVVAQSATRLSVAEGYLGGAALDFLLGKGRLVDQFEVTLKSCSKAAIELDLLPRADASYERLGLAFRPESGEILATSATDLFGNRTSIRFTNPRVDQAPPLATFHFVPPEGTEVMDLEGPALTEGPAAAR